ncbi:MAG: polysialyltransferase family glycosyltransferase [Eubacterium sp.]
MDYFITTLFDLLKRNNKSLILNYYEDGTASYTKRLSWYYELFKKPSGIKNISHNNIFKKYTIYSNFNEFCVFAPKLLEWYPEGSKVTEIDKIDITDNIFKKIINYIFDYDNLEDKYEEKYIFFEESFYADTGYMEDVNLIEKLADIVGKENLLIKIHPRNPENRFAKMGYKTNVNTAIPWEIIAMNIDLTDKKIIAVASTSIINPIQVLGIDANAYSLIRCLDEIPQLLNSPLSQTVINLFKAYPDNIILCQSIEEISK